MKIYYVSIRRYDGGNEVFPMCADSPEEAIKNGRKFISQSTYYSPTVYNHGSLHIVKKVANILEKRAYHMIVEGDDLVYPEHDDAYLKECLENLKGKGIVISIGH